MQPSSLPIHLRRVDAFASATMPILAQQHLLNGTYELHSHDFIEMVFILGGSGQHATPYGEQALGAGDIFCMRPGAWHAYQACQHLLVYNCCFTIELLDQPLGWLRNDPRIAPLLWGTSAPLAGLTCTHLAVEVLATCRSHLDHLHALIEAEPQPRVVPLRLIGHLLVLLGVVADGVDQDVMPPPPYHRTVAEGMQMLAEQLAHPWTLRALADRVHLDPAYLVRLFTAQVGIAPMTWLAQQRLARAATLLAHTPLSIAQIAEEVGWPDATHFARRFKAHTGMSASTYRAQLQHEPVQADITHADPAS